VSGHGSESAVVTNRRKGRIFFRSNESHIVEFKFQIVDRFLNQIGVSLTDVLELRRRNTHVEDAIFRMAEASGLEPCVKGLTIDFLFQCAEDAHPGIEHGGGCCDERHLGFPY
jgi:hypothetical protein